MLSILNNPALKMLGTEVFPHGSTCAVPNTSITSSPSYTGIKSLKIQEALTSVNVPIAET